MCESPTGRLTNVGASEPADPAGDAPISTFKVARSSKRRPRGATRRQLPFWGDFATASRWAAACCEPPSTVPPQCRPLMRHPPNPRLLSTAARFDTTPVSTPTAHASRQCPFPHPPVLSPETSEISQPWRRNLDVVAVGSQLHYTSRLQASCCQLPIANQEQSADLPLLRPASPKAVAPQPHPPCLRFLKPKVAVAGARSRTSARAVSS
jgi:hypothetical protein